MSTTVTTTEHPSIESLLLVLDELAGQRPVAARLVRMADDEEVGARELGNVLALDPLLSARVMRIANSAYYGLSGRVSTVPFAVTMVGASTVRSIAAVAAAGLDRGEDTPPRFWELSKTAATAAREVAPAFGVPGPDLFSAGLLASLGVAILSRYDEARYTALLERVGTGSRSTLAEAEYDEYGVTHTQVSAAALAEWSFPRDLVEGVRGVDFASLVTPTRSVALRAALEVATRVVYPERDRTDLTSITSGVVSEETAENVVTTVRQAAAASDW